MPHDGKKRTWLFVVPWSLSDLGGVNHVVTSLARQALDDTRFQPLILFLDWDARRPVFGEVHGIPTVRWRIRPFREGMGLKEWVLFYLSEPAFGRAFSRFCSQQRVAVVNPHFADELTLHLDRTIRHSTPALPMVISLHGSDVETIHASSYQNRMRWAGVFTRALAVVACSEALGRRWSEVFNRTPSLKVIHNGVSTSRFTRCPAPDTTGERPPAFLSVGKFDQNKGHDILIDAFASITAQYPDATLTIVGGTGTGTAGVIDALRHQVRELRIESKVTVHEDVPHDRILEFYQKATHFVLSSRREGFSLVLLEAGAMGLPVITTSVGGSPEIIEDGITGRLVPPDDSVALAKAIQEMLADPPRAVGMGRRLRQRIEATFEWKKAWAGYTSLLQEESGRQEG